MLGISVLLSCLLAGFLIFFFFLSLLVSNSLPLQCLFLPPVEYFTPLCLQPYLSFPFFCSGPELAEAELKSSLIVANWTF